MIAEEAPSELQAAIPKKQYPICITEPFPIIDFKLVWATVTNPTNKTLPKANHIRNILQDWAASGNKGAAIWISPYSPNFLILQHEAWKPMLVRIRSHEQPKYEKETEQQEYQSQKGVDQKFSIWLIRIKGIQ